MESLERRQLMSVIPTDMTQLAVQQKVSHVGPTELYVNFDGGSINDTQAGGAVTISAFTAKPGANLNQSIEDILYRVSEIYAPFDVQVRRLTGAGNYATTDGASTIFVGADAVDTITSGKTTVKVIAGFTPSASGDFPGAGKGYGHTLNSDDYDLGFVDPVGNDTNGPDTIESDLQIAQGIAHEAGHTFGLAHVLSSPANDVMSYDASNSFFADQTFNLTDENWNAATQTLSHTPTVVPTIIASSSAGRSTLIGPRELQTQNSYTYLSQVLGALNESLDAYPHHVADISSVDPAYFKQIHSASTALTIGQSASEFAALGSADVFALTNTSSSSLTERIVITPAQGFSPEMLFYNSAGNDFLSGYHSTSELVTVPAHTTDDLVVGGYDGNSYGNFTVSAESPFNSRGKLVGHAVLLKTPTGSAASSSAYVGIQGNTPIDLLGELKNKSLRSLLE